MSVRQKFWFRIAQGFILNFIHRFADETFDEECSRISLRNSARHTIEQQILVELRRRCAVSADHIIRINLKLRL